MKFLEMEKITMKCKAKTAQMRNRAFYEYENESGADQQTRWRLELVERDIPEPGAGRFA